MDKLKFAECLGKKIIEAQHDYYRVEKSDDLKHITNIKRIIVAISDYLKSDGLQDEGTDAIAENLRQLSKRLFLESCISNRHEDENEDEVRAESEIYFDYIYKYEKYPR